MQIRSATERDVPAVEQLLRDSQLPTIGVKDIISDFLVAEAGNDVVGVIGMEYCCNYGLLRSAAVASTWRSKGLGRELVHRIIARAESRGINALYLLTTTAEQYFPTFGFQKVAREVVPPEIQATEEFREACPASAAVLSLQLTGRG